MFAVFELRNSDFFQNQIPRRRRCHLCMYSGIRISDFRTLPIFPAELSFAGVPHESGTSVGLADVLRCCRYIVVSELKPDKFGELNMEKYVHFFRDR